MNKLVEKNFPLEVQVKRMLLKLGGDHHAEAPKVMINQGAVKNQRRNGVLLKERFLEAKMLSSLKIKLLKIKKIWKINSIPRRVAYNHGSCSFSRRN